MGKSGSSVSITLLLAAMLALSFGMDLKVEARKPPLHIDAKLKLLNKPAVKTIKSEDGDIIDCVDIYKQPAFDCPALKQHRIQAAYLVTMGYNYIGAQPDIKLWNPEADLSDDFTTAQIWLKAGNGHLFESVEAGWVANPKLYGDKAIRLFAYWITDSYKSTGCFDLACPGFLLTNKDIALGVALQTVSSKSGQQYHITSGIFLDMSSNWWLTVGDTPIGCWPPKIFGSLSHSSTLVEWGGEVFSSHLKNKTPHTATGMGSGDFAIGLAGRACYMNNIRIKDYSLAPKYPEFVSDWAGKPYCYNSKN